MQGGAIKEFQHLNEDVANIAMLDDEARLRFIAKDRFIPYGKAEQILNDLEHLYRSEDSLRPQGRMLTGISLMGKSTLIDEFVRNHRASDDPDGDAVHCPVISVQYPDVTGYGIYPEILRALNANSRKVKRQFDMREHCLELLEMVSCRLIIIDEFHNILAGTTSRRDEGLNGIKFLMNHFRRPIVVAGTQSCRNAIKHDDQFVSRLYPLELSPFRNDQDFAMLLAGFEALLPLRKPSFLYSGEVKDKIHRLTGGVTGYISDLLNKASRVAIEEGTEQITSKELDEAGWLMPSSA